MGPDEFQGNSSMYQTHKIIWKECASFIVKIQFFLCNSILSYADKAILRHLVFICFPLEGNCAK